jgi:hypothetical protein
MLETTLFFQLNITLILQKQEEKTAVIRRKSRLAKKMWTLPSKSLMSSEHHELQTWTHNNTMAPATAKPAEITL